MKILSLNPLFIRSSIPFGLSGRTFLGTQHLVSIPYSSGHLFRFEGVKNRSIKNKEGVSIPYSSGHLFRSLATSRMRPHAAPASQSLIHQVIYSVCYWTLAPVNTLGCLNPLFIRSSIPLSLLRPLCGCRTISLNPLFIRSSIPFER